MLVPRQNSDGSIVLDTVRESKNTQKSSKLRRIKRSDQVDVVSEDELNTTESVDDVIEIITETRLVDPK